VSGSKTARVIEREIPFQLQREEIRRKRGKKNHRDGVEG